MACYLALPGNSSTWELHYLVIAIALRSNSTPCPMHYLAIALANNSTTQQQLNVSTREISQLFFLIISKLGRFSFFLDS